MARVARRSRASLARVSQGVTTVSVIYAEYEHGIDGKPAVKNLDMVYSSPLSWRSSRWRARPEDAKYIKSAYSKMKHFYDAFARGETAAELQRRIEVQFPGEPPRVQHIAWLQKQLAAQRPGFDVRSKRAVERAQSVRAKRRALEPASPAPASPAATRPPESPGTPASNPPSASTPTHTHEILAAFEAEEQWQLSVPSGARVHLVCAHEDGWSEVVIFDPDGEMCGHGMVPHSIMQPIGVQPIWAATHLLVENEEGAAPAAAHDARSGVWDDVYAIGNSLPRL